MYCVNIYSLNVSTTPLRQWSFQQCLRFSWTTLRGKHCRHSIAIMGVVDTFGQCVHLLSPTYWVYIIFQGRKFSNIFLFMFWQCDDFIYSFWDFITFNEHGQENSPKVSKIIHCPQEFSIPEELPKCNTENPLNLTRVGNLNNISC